MTKIETMNNGFIELIPENLRSHFNNCSWVINPNGN